MQSKWKVKEQIPWNCKENVIEWSQTGQHLRLRNLQTFNGI